METFVEQQLHALFLDLGERIANGEFGDFSDDEMCGIPWMLFKAEMRLVDAWRRFVTQKGQPDDQSTLLPVA
jgi:hypothetical protein